MSYRELEIYRVSKKLALEVHAMTLELPKFEMYEEGGQARRSSKSVTSMIVEGYGRRRYKADYIKYLVYSQAECDETIVHLEFLLESEKREQGKSRDRRISHPEPTNKQIHAVGRRQLRPRSWSPRAGPERQLVMHFAMRFFEPCILHQAPSN